MGDGSLRMVLPPSPHVAVPARAALAGNPSDGFGGAVVAVPLRCFAASVTVTPSSSGTITPGDEDLLALVDAARRAGSRLIGLPATALDEIALAVHTTIPRSVGLAGSSAIVIAVLRAMTVGAPEAPWSRTLADADAMAVVARSAEVDELAIAAGLQDRLVQAHDEALLMDFDDASTFEVLGRPCGTAVPLPRPPGRFVLAHRPATAASSQVVHGGLIGRDDTAPLMAELAATARDAATAIRRGSVPDLARSMDRTFDLRSDLLDLDPHHVEMVEAARRAGGHANYTGSGGAVIVLCADDDVARRVVRDLGGLDGCVVTVDPLDDSSAAV